LSVDPAAKPLAEAKRLTKLVKAGRRSSAQAFGDLVQLLLSLTVMKEGGAVILWTTARKDKEVFFVSSQNRKPIQLLDDRYLWLSFQLFLGKSGRKSGPKKLLKVTKTAIEYCADREQERRIFRYEYERGPRGPYSGNHLHIYGDLTESVLPEKKPLYKVHFPTARFSVESILRLLIEDFGVPTRKKPEVWRPVLAWTEEEFCSIRHAQISGPRS
jgi:hypothetical protein